MGGLNINEENFENEADLNEENSENEVEVNETVSELLSMLKSAKSGDKDARNLLIKKYKPFIISSASEACGRFLVVGHDDEISIALMAFNEAIDSFDFEKSTAFLSFAKNVIKRRLIDYFRKESRYSSEITTSDFVDSDEEKEVNVWEVRQAEDAFIHENDVNARRDEIVHFSSELNDMGISFSELVEISPKHEDARLRAMEIASIVASDPMLLQYMKQKKSLPAKKIEKMCDCSAKTVERQRKYIIAVVLIIKGDYHYLKEYLKLPQIG